MSLKSKNKTFLHVCLLTALFSVPRLSIAGNYAECLLARMPGTANDIAAYQINRGCFEKYPALFSDTPQGSGRGALNAILGYDSGSECVAKLAKETASTFAASRIAVACHKLYDEFALMPFVPATTTTVIRPRDQDQKQSRTPSAPLTPVAAVASEPIKPDPRSAEILQGMSDGTYGRKADECVIKGVMTDSEIQACRRKR